MIKPVKISAMGIFGAVASVSLLGTVSASAVEVNPDPRAWPSNCSHSYFCAYANADYKGGQLLSSRAASGQKEVKPSQADAVSSVANRTTNLWHGKNKKSLAADPTLFVFSAGSGYMTPGSSWDNMIDHFDVQ